MAFCDSNLTELLRGRTALAFSSVWGSLHSSLWQSKGNKTFISFGFWWISYPFIHARVILSKIQIQVRIWLVHPQKDRGCFRHKFERDINNPQLSMPSTVTMPGEETSYRILIKSEIKSEHKRLLWVFYLQLQENPCLLTLCDDFCFTETIDRPRRQFYQGIPWWIYKFIGVIYCSIGERLLIEAWVSQRNLHHRKPTIAQTAVQETCIPIAACTIWRQLHGSLAYPSNGWWCV